MTLEIIQRSEASNGVWQSLEPYYRAKGTRDKPRLSHEANEKTMQPGEYPFKPMVEIDRLAADFYRLGDKFVTELRKCVIIVAGVFADYQIECRILENNLVGPERAEIERIVGNKHDRLFR